MNLFSYITILPPALIIIVGALFIPFFKGKIRSAFMLLLPVLTFLVLVYIPEGNHWSFSFIGYEIVLGRIDRLSLVFGYIFCIAIFIAVLFALKVDETTQHVAAMIYAGSALGVTFAGDLLSLYVFWEVMAVSSTFLILASRTKEAYAAAYKYILIHILGGLFLLAGIIMYYAQNKTMMFDYIGLNGPASYLIFIGILINVGAPPLHPWIKDAYPEATVTGAVFLCTFTTKSAVYLLTRTFPGTNILIVLGALMAAFPIFYAVLENNIRRVLAYSLINQIGFMVCGIGIGTELALNGTISHAFCHIIYKQLLFMSTGSVLFMTGKIKCTDLGGVYKTMPITCLFCIVAAASISAFPLFSGFVSKSMIVSAAGYGHMAIIWLVLQFASAGVIHHHGVKVPYFTFFGEDSGIRTKEPPMHMMMAMAIAAFLCIFIGVYPKPLYALLPYTVDYVPYTASHVVGMLQLLMFGILAFAILVLSGHYPPEMRAINLDTDWFYRKGGRLFYQAADHILNGINRISDTYIAKKVSVAAGQVAENTPARFIGFLLMPVKVFVKGPGKDMLDAAQNKADRMFETTSVPIGLSVAAASLFIIILFFLS